MLIEFRVANFKSFREEQVLSMVASSEKELPENCIQNTKPKLLKSVVIYGPNASGKSNLFEALITMKMIVLRPSITEPETTLEISPFKFDDSSSKEPTFFEVTLILQDVRYQYGFTAFKDRIDEEWLYAYPNNRAQKWFERSFDNENKKAIFEFGSNFSGNRKKMQDMTRTDSLYLSIGAYLNNEQLIKIYEWFKYELRIIDDVKFIEGVTAKMLHIDQDNVFKKFTINLLKKADFDISDIIVDKEEKEQPKLPPNINPEERENVLLRITRGWYKVWFNHKYNKDNRLSWDEESKGTRQFFMYLGPYIQCLVAGWTLVIDEFDRSLHPLLLNEIISSFHDSDFNKKGAQLIFNTHNTIFLNPDLFRRDQIWLTEKNNEGVTNLYSLSEYKPRKGEALQKGYLSGRYGAVPILERFNLNGIEKNKEPERSKTS